MAINDGGLAVLRFCGFAEKRDVLWLLVPEGAFVMRGNDKLVGDQSGLHHIRSRLSSNNFAKEVALRARVDV